MIKKILCLFGTLCCLFLVACNDRPDNVLSEKETVDLLADLKLSQSYYNVASPDQRKLDRDLMTQSVLDKHGVSQEVLDSTLSYYGRNIDEYILLYDKVEKKLNVMAGKEEMQEIENDIWPYSRFSVFLPGQSTGGLTFSIPGVGVDPGNTLEWRMRLTSSGGANAMLGVEYENGVSEVRNASGARNMNVKLVTDTAKSIKRIFGVLQTPDNTLPVWADSIQLVKIETDIRTYTKPSIQKYIYKPKAKEKEQKKDTTDSVKISSILHNPVSSVK